MFRIQSQIRLPSGEYLRKMNFDQLWHLVPCRTSMANFWDTPWRRVSNSDLRKILDESARE